MQKLATFNFWQRIGRAVLRDKDFFDEERIAKAVRCKARSLSHVIQTKSDRLAIIRGNTEGDDIRLANKRSERNSGSWSASQLYRQRRYSSRAQAVSDIVTETT